MNESRPDVTHIWMSHVTHIWMSHVTLPQMSHAAHTKTNLSFNRARHVLCVRRSNVTCTWMSHVTLPYTRHTLIHESCHTCTRMSHVTHIHANLSFYRARHTLYVRMSHVTRAWMSHVTILYTSQFTHVHAHANLSFNRASHTLYVRMPKIHRSHIPGYFLQRGLEPPLEVGQKSKKKNVFSKKKQLKSTDALFLAFDTFSIHWGYIYKDCIRAGVHIEIYGKYVDVYMYMYTYTYLYICIYIQV